MVAPNSCGAALRLHGSGLPWAYAALLGVPIVVEGKEVMPTAGGASLGSALLSMAWYYTATTTTVQIPEVVEVAVAGAEEVV